MFFMYMNIPYRLDQLVYEQVRVQRNMQNNAHPQRNCGCAQKYEGITITHIHLKGALPEVVGEGGAVRTGRQGHVAQRVAMLMKKRGWNAVNMDRMITHIQTQAPLGLSILVCVLLILMSVFATYYPRTI